MQAKTTLSDFINYCRNDYTNGISVRLRHLLSIGLIRHNYKCVEDLVENQEFRKQRGVGETTWNEFIEAYNYFSKKEKLKTKKVESAKVKDLKIKLHQIIDEFEKQNGCGIAVTFYDCESERDKFTLICSTG